MGLKPSIQQKLRQASKNLTVNAPGKAARERDFPDLCTKIENLPVPYTAGLPNTTTADRRSLAQRGNSNAMKHGIFSKRAPSMLCDKCYLVRSVMDENYKIKNAADVACPYYQEGAACIFMAQALNSNVRNFDDLKVLAEETLELDMQRITMARAIEVYEGGGILDQSLDMALERIGKNMSFVKDFYMQLEDMKNKNRVPTGKPGILAQLLAEGGVMPVEAKVENA